MVVVASAHSRIACMDTPLRHELGGLYYSEIRPIVSALPVEVIPVMALFLSDLW